MVLLPGGPTHLDTFDLKPDAPAEIRGEFRPIATNVPGIDICELMPRLARMADKLAIIRSLVGFRDDHNTHWCSTGWESHPAMDSSPIVPGFPPGDWPSLGSVLSPKARPAGAGSAAVRRSDADGRRRAVHPAHAAGAARLSGRGPRRVRSAGRRSPEHHAQRRRPPSPGRPPGLAGQLRWFSPAMSMRAGVADGIDDVSAAGLRAAHLVTAGERARPQPGRRRQPQALRSGSRLSRRARRQDATSTSSCWPGA